MSAAQLQVELNALLGELEVIDLCPPGTPGAC